jgi:hypothetical protein
VLYLEFREPSEIRSASFVFFCKGAL